MKEPSISDSRKQQKQNNMRKAEAEYLRFLRTKERPENFATLKIIGKGAFGEVKLVQRKNDGKIYALKSLVKSEMVQLLKPRNIWAVDAYSVASSKRTSSPTSGQSVISLLSRTVRGSLSCIRLSRTTLSYTC